MKAAFCHRLSQLRIARNVSARDMSLSLGQNAGYINNIENGHNLPSMSVFFEICTFFGVTPKQFFDYEQADPFQRNELEAALAALTPTQAADLLTFLKDIVNI
jgi:transcriptional regulator with XRE-family HTH domain